MSVLAELEPADPHPPTVPHSFDGPVCSLTTRQRTRMAKRTQERRKISPAAFLARVKAVLEAYRAKDRWLLVGALEDLASACLAWSSYIRADRGWDK